MNHTYVDRLRSMLKEKSVYVIGGCLLGGFIYIVYRTANKKTKERITHKPHAFSNASVPKSSSNIETIQLPLYDQEVVDEDRYQYRSYVVKMNPAIRNLNYRLILSLNKGNNYQGVVLIDFELGHLSQNETPLGVNYNGAAVLALVVNGVLIDRKNVVYCQHRIELRKEWLYEQSKNNLQIVFQNNYSFLDNGISSYFPIDDNHKYSLRQQVIYTKNGYLQVQNMMPCFNCLNECQFSLEMLHPDKFDTISNNTKSLERSCSILEYPRYRFFFDSSYSSLNRSFRAAEMVNSHQINSQGTSFKSLSTSVSRKTNTHWNTEHLLSIHNLFVFSSDMVQVKPKLDMIMSSSQDQLLLRYFCKQQLTANISRNLRKIHKFVLQTTSKLQNEQIFSLLVKIDIIIIADANIEGYFAPGVILMDQSSFTEQLAIRTYYLIARAILGILLLAKRHKFVTVNDILKLNWEVVNRFDSFRNYIFLKNMKYNKIRKMIAQKRQFVRLNEGQFLQFFAKEMRFIVEEDLSNYVSSELKPLIQAFFKENSEVYWSNLVEQYNFLSPLICQPLIKLSLKFKSLPESHDTFQLLKVTLENSFYLLHFLSNREIEENFKFYIEKGLHGMEKRLPQLKIRERHKEFLNEHYEKYVRLPSNFEQAKAIYDQLKRYRQNKNFHHCSVLKKEIKRIGYLGKDFIKQERIDLECGMKSWRLLIKLQMYPRNETQYRVISVFKAALE